MGGAGRLLAQGGVGRAAAGGPRQAGHAGAGGSRRRGRAHPGHEAPAGIKQTREFTPAQWEETTARLTDKAQRDQLCGLRPAQRGAALVDKTVEVLAWVSWAESAEKLKNAWPFVERGGMCRPQECWR